MSVQAAKDFAGGLVAGWTQVVIMQPFEKIKVMLQTQGPVKKYDGISDVIRHVMKEEGFMGFYKGTLVPLIGIGFIGSVRFGVF
jgi:solute carrier family 25 carnitine/acylcarnitine transporter 20/29